MKKQLLPLLCLLLLCSCGTTPNDTETDSQPTPTQDTAFSENIQYKTVEREGKTAVLLEDSTLTHCYSASYDENNQISWLDLSQDVALKAGSMVLVLTEEETTSQVYVLSGDTPGSLYGSLPTDVLSQKENDLVTGNLADAEDKMAYDSINGKETEQLIGTVTILARQDGWCQVASLTGGDTRTFWLPEKELSFHMDSTVIDREAG